ncbi:hypothetical protein ACSVDA_19055 [Cytobacillus sp. Hm23]
MDKQNKVKSTMEDETELPLGTTLNPSVMLTANFDSNNPFKSEIQFSGDSTNEHVIQQEANEYIAQKEIGQSKNNS